MNWTENPEARRLYDWACRNAAAFPEAASYYQPFDNRDNVCEYGFSSVPELEEQLAALWKDEPGFDGIRKVLAIAAFKRRPAEAEDSREEPLRIPDFVYTF